MKLEDIINIDPAELMKMNRKELSKVVSKAASAANKRIKRLEKGNIESPAYRYIVKSGGNFSVKNKNLNQLRSEYYRVSDFLKSKTSTIKGAKQVKKAIDERIGGALKPGEYSDFWDAYHKLEELEPNFLRLYGSEQMQQFLRNQIIGSENDVDSIVKNCLDEIENKYMEKEADFDDMGEFFKI